MKMNKISTRKAWTIEEDIEVLALYETMRGFQIMGIKYSKAPLVRELAEKLDRSRGSIECSLMNASSIYMSHNLEIVKGYKALPNCRKSLKDAYAILNQSILNKGVNNG